MAKETSRKVTLVAEAILRELEGWRGGRKANASSMLRRLLDDDGTALSEEERAVAIEIWDDGMSMMFELEAALHRLAPEHGLELDRSASKGMRLGLPFHIDFVVRHTKTA